MKRFFSLFLVVVLVFSFIVQSFSYADVIEELNNPKLLDDTVSGSDTTGGGSVKENIKDPAEQSESEDFKLLSWLAKIFFGFLEELANPNSWVLWLIYMLPTVDGIIFNVDDYFRISYFETPSTTNPSLASRIVVDISAFYNAFRYLVTACYIVILVYIGIRMMLSSIGRQKAKYKEMFKYWLIGLLMLFSFHWVMAFFVWLSNTFVDILREFTCSLLKEHHTIGITDAVFNTGDNYPITSYIVSKIRDFDFPFLVVGWFLKKVIKPITILIFSYMLIKQGWNFVKVYFVRLISISILILIFPIVVLSYVFDKMGDRRAQTFETWFKEFTVNVFIQPIHALILCFVGAIYAYASDIFILHSSLLAPLFALFCLRLLPVGEDYLKRLFQIQAQTGPGSHGIAGSVAMANRTMEGFKNMATAPIKTLKGAADLRRLKQRHAGDEAKYMKSFEDDIRNGRMTREDAQRKAREAARKDYEKDRKENNIKSGRELKANAFGMLSGSSSAITGAGRGQFVSEALRKANMRSELYGGIARGIEDRPWDKLLNGDATKSEDFEKRGRPLDGLSPEEAKKLANNEEKVKQIAIDLNLKPEQVKQMLKDGKSGELAKAYSEVGNQLRWGAKLDDAKNRSTLAIRQKEISKAVDEKNGEYLKAGIITDDGHEYITNDGTYIKKDGILFKVSDQGSKSLKNGQMLDYNPNEGISLDEKVKQLVKDDKEYQESISRCPDGEKSVEKASKLLSEAHADEEAKKKAWENAGRKQSGPECEAYVAAQSVTEEAKTKLSEVRDAYRTQQKIENNYKSTLEEADKNHLLFGAELPSFTETAETMRPENSQDIVGSNGERYFELHDSVGNTRTYVKSIDSDTAQRKQFETAEKVAKSKFEDSKTQTNDLIAQHTTATNTLASEESTLASLYTGFADSNAKIADLNSEISVKQTAISTSSTRLSDVNAELISKRQARDIIIATGNSTAAIDTEITRLKKTQSGLESSISADTIELNNLRSEKTTIVNQINVVNSAKEAVNVLETKIQESYYTETIAKDLYNDATDNHATVEGIYQHTTSASLGDVSRYVNAQVSDSTATQIDVALSDYQTALSSGNQAQINIARAKLQQAEIVAQAEVAQVLDNNLKDPTLATTYTGSGIVNNTFGGSINATDIAAAFAGGDVAKEKLGNSDISLSTLNQALYQDKEGFAYTSSDELRTFLHNYEGFKFNIKIEREATQLICTLFPTYGHNTTTSLSTQYIPITIDFSSPDLANVGDVVTIAYDNGYWYKL